MTTNPKRVRMSSDDGYKIPAGAISVGRVTRWGNPFRAEDAPMTNKHQAHAWAAYRFECWIVAPHLFPDIMARPPSKEAIVRDLRGKDLACLCRSEFACHADVLIRWANS